MEANWVKRSLVQFVVFALLLAFAAPAAAHHLAVNPPGEGNGTEHWVGGPPGRDLPGEAQGQGLHATPFGTMFPAAHSAGPNDDKGLVQACESTNSNPSVVVFAAPPFGSCHHGRP
jgi:hypothetical protein